MKLTVVSVVIDGVTGDVNAQRYEHASWQFVVLFFAAPTACVHSMVYSGPTLLKLPGYIFLIRQRCDYTTGIKDHLWASNRITIDFD